MTRDELLIELSAIEHALQEFLVVRRVLVAPDGTIVKQICRISDHPVINRKR